MKTPHQLEKNKTVVNLKLLGAPASTCRCRHVCITVCIWSGACRLCASVVSSQPLCERLLCVFQLRNQARCAGLVPSWLLPQNKTACPSPVTMHTDSGNTQDSHTVIPIFVFLQLIWNQCTRQSQAVCSPSHPPATCQPPFNKFLSAICTLFLLKN